LTGTVAHANRRKVVLITGGGAGIGRAAAVEFARAGAAVVVADRHEASAQAVAAQIRDAGGHALGLVADVTRENDVRRMVAETIAQLGALDCAFNNAGIMGPIGTPLHELPESDWDDVVATNLKSVWLSMKHEIVAMLRVKSGVVVNNASIVGLRAATHNPAYGAAKHGVVGLTRAAAAYYGDKGLRINAICPGIVDTRMTQSGDGGPGDPIVERVQRTPLRRAADPAEVARTVVWLCSTDASYLNGVALPVDGGLSVLA
jgi:NAD(P)-dependent dehydrogenase (short-subunit alcohol dehydrogenase family)